MIGCCKCSIPKKGPGHVFMPRDSGIGARSEGDAIPDPLFGRDWYKVDICTLCMKPLKPLKKEND